MNFNEITLQRTPLIRKSNGKSSLVTFEFSLPNNLPETFSISFQNWYTSSIILIQDIGTQSINLCSPIKLMDSSYDESKAQNWFEIPSSELSSQLVKNKPIKIILLHNSNIWQKYDIKCLKVVFKNEIDKEGSGKLNDYIKKPVVTLSDTLLADFTFLQESALQQLKTKFLQEPYFYNSIEISKRSLKRKEKKKEKRNSVVQNNSNIVEGVI